MCSSMLSSAFLALCIFQVTNGSVRDILRSKGLLSKREQHDVDISLGDPDITLNDPHHQQQQQEMCFTIPHLQALKSQFANYIDKNGDERASRSEIVDYLLKYNPRATEKQISEFIARRDMDGDGSVDFIPDYLMEVSSPDYDLKTAEEWFSLEDSNGDGRVSADELVDIALKVGMPKEEAERTVAGYYMAADKNGDNELSWDEYKVLFLP